MRPTPISKLYLVGWRDDRVDDRVERLVLGERGVDHLDGRKLTTADAGGLLDGR
jgi:hypothetical protein